jgi:hypothetical protein
MIIIDLTYLFQILLPMDLRLPLVKEFLNEIKKSLQFNYTGFYSLFENTKYNLIFNGQVCMLKHLLDDRYDNTLRRIEIIQDTSGKPTYLFNDFEDNEKTYLFNKGEVGKSTYLYNSDEILGLTDFIIRVPSDVIFNEVQLRKLVDKYKLPDKTYSIQIV